MGRSPIRRLSHVFSVAAFLCFASLLAAAQSKDNKDWRLVTPEELAQKTPKVEPDADAEAIFWEVRIDDSAMEDLSLRHYIRVKIFTERGREKYAKMDIPFTKGLTIKDLAARVIKPDGSIVDIKNEDIFEREIVKADGLKVKAKSFAVPNIEPGVIVEYKYKEAIREGTAKGMRLAFQREIPVQSLVYYYKPYNSDKPSYQTYNFADTKFLKDKGGYWVASRTDVPSFKEEPRMPPADSVRPFMMLTGAGLSIQDISAFGDIFFTVKNPGDPSAYWGAVATDYTPVIKLITKSGGDLKKTAADITTGASTSEEKLKKIYDYCQSQIKNTTYDATLTDDDRKKLPPVKSVADILKRKSASSFWIDVAFGALAHAAGFEVRMVLIGERENMLFDPRMTNEKLVRARGMAVSVDGTFKVYDPGNPFLSAGALTWYDEDAYALMIGEKDYYWRHTPLTAPEGSVTKRTGKFRLLEDGTLEGEVRMELSGHPAVDYRLDNYDDAPAKRETNFRDELTARISTAEVSDVAIENVDTASKPLVINYKVRVPNYAQKTGKRLFLQPGFFEYGSNPLFSSGTRKYDIFFEYPWSEMDSLEIKYPANYDLDNADSPEEVADNSRIGVDNINIRVDRTNSILLYERKFTFGGGGHVLFDSKMYEPLKGMFDAFHKADSHTITLKQK